jgi:hypothetical protein
MHPCVATEYRKEMGEIKPDTLVTMHIVHRPSAVAAKGGSGAAL